MLVQERFVLNPIMQRNLRQRKEAFGFGLLGAATYFRTYSRVKENGQQERWADTVIRAVEGAMSIRKNHYVQHHIAWDEEKWQTTACEMADAIFYFRFLPPGRGLFAGGTEHVYEKGSGALNNCSFVSVKKLSEDTSWIMRFLMLGVGVGFSTYDWNSPLFTPREEQEVYVIEDTREAWGESLQKLFESYERGGNTIVFDYSKVRPQGMPIRGFGGTASGPEPLKRVHDFVRAHCEAFIRGELSRSRFVTDVVNQIAVAVIAGNTRRSALIALGRPDDTEFLNLKNWRLPENQARMNFDTGWGHTSNNSAVLFDPSDFDYLPELAELVKLNGEPGILNLMNVQKYGRMGEKKIDRAVGVNPCGEIPLEDYELCNLAEVIPIRCKTETQLMDAFRLATIYASSIALLLTDDDKTNDVIIRNRRIGVSITGVADWMASTTKKSDIVRQLNQGYDLVKAVNTILAIEAHVAQSIRLTTVKPSGTVSLLAGVSAGMHHPIFDQYVRRMKVANTSPVFGMLEQANVPFEPDRKEPDVTSIFEFPIRQKGVRPQDEVSFAEHSLRLLLLQRFWADNSVSNTSTYRATRYEDERGNEYMWDQDLFVKKGKELYVKNGTDLLKITNIDKGEEDSIESWMIYTAPHVKSLSILSYMKGKTVYPQAPYQGIDDDEFERRSAQIKPVDWNSFTGSDGEDSRYCEGDSCVI
jgi:ribonucleoside-triphosphate reductase